ncbi:type I R/M system specificity subunit [Leuconostoc carnosum JB16]|uniref:Type I R/M system specificity subunit n=1 Tax=Leuconostoc carnosum (strain JB16) TaxID=1229758 RepID=K0DDU2_LEUCJ|nr:restriction endonuclease subunit S [Leuconostoc carnosum]AFT81702.1 type I R/M system specificity subunit [Leuconostoc carnosum JB16]
MNKMTPQIRFQGFTDDWEERKLSEIGKIVTGNTPSTSNKGYYNGDFLFVSPADIQENRYVNKTTTTLTELGFKTGRLVPKGATLFVSIGSTIGKIGQSICDVITNQQINSVISFSDYDDDFIYTSILNSSTKIKQLAATQAVPIINKNEFGKSIIKIPSLEEQQKIGAFFKQLDDTIALHQRKLDLLKEQKKGFLQKMFPKNGAKVPELRFSGFADDWEERNLGNIAGNLSDGDWIESNHIFDTGKYRIVQTGNIGIGSFLDKPQNAKYFHQADFDELKANEIFSGDILISRLSDPAGRTSILPDLGVPAVTAVDVAIIRPTDNFNSEFLVSELNSSAILSKVDSLASGSTRKRISRKNLESVKISLPTFEEQQKIGSFFKQLDDTIALHQRKLDLLKEQKKGFLQKMFVS